MNAVENYIFEHQGEEKEVMYFLHQLFTGELMLREKLSYGIPFYYRKSWVCYINPLKGGGVELAFPRGNELSNEQGVLDNRGRKQVFGMTIKSMKDLDENIVREILHEAILLDQTVAYASKRKNH